MSSASIKPSAQLDAIYSMMEGGQHSVKMERHTLLIWGITAAVLILITDLIFNRETISTKWVLIASQTAFISVILFAAGYYDIKLTRKVRIQRDESLSFIQLQLTKVWWFFVGLIVLLNVGMNFFGGGYMFYGLTLSLIGMAFYVQGLFSAQMLKWVGSMLILLGLASIALNLHFLATKWLAAGAFGLGMPMLAFILDKPITHSSGLKRIAISLAWFVIVIIPSTLAYHYELGFDPGELPVRTLQEYNKLSAEESAQQQIIKIPSGTEIPVNIEMDGNVVESKAAKALSIRLTKDLDVVINKGNTNGRFKIGDSEWKNRIYHLAIMDFKMKSVVEQDKGASVNLGFRLDVK